MEQQFDASTIRDFLKTLIELGDVHYIDNEGNILYSVDDSPVGVATKANGKEVNKGICLFKEGMQPNPEVRILNPFVQELGRRDEQDWFFNVLMALPGCLVTKTLQKLLELATSGDDADFKQSAILSPFIERIDKKFVQEIEKARIRPLELASIYYDKKEHIAQLQSDLFEEDWATEMKNKLRKSSIKLLRDIVGAMLKTDQPHEIYYSATIIGCPKFDAIVHCLLETIKRIQPMVEALLPIKLKVEELEVHVQNLAAYQKAMRWLAPSTTTSSQPTSPVKAAEVKANDSTPPWRKPSVQSNPLTPTLPSQSTAGGSFASAVPVGSRKPPQFPMMGAMMMGNVSFGNNVPMFMPGGNPLACTVPQFGGGTVDFSTAVGIRPI